ncbi:catalase [Mycena alexandri]|uniref:Catalase n=1 Tax=Mycena alexandri TaxID=1745969 RepID=A0AAD6TEB9_9AGAR|nr:catalase [Mycena alexandri]
MAAPFSDGVGTKVPLTMHFSTVAGEAGSPDTNRDPREFAIKLRTSKGIWDWVFNNTPVFFIRDPTKFPLFIHSQKRNPQTNLRTPNSQWDYWSQNQEAIYQILILFSNRGYALRNSTIEHIRTAPASWAQMHGWSGHTYKWVTETGDWHYVKVKVISDEGINNLNATEAKDLIASNLDHNTQDLRQVADRITAGKFPSWTVAIQTMTPAESLKFKYDVNDMTKIWPEDEYPLLEVGKIVLNKNPDNWFAEIEQPIKSPFPPQTCLSAPSRQMIPFCKLAYLRTRTRRVIVWDRITSKYPSIALWRSTITSAPDGCASTEARAHCPLERPTILLRSRPRSRSPLDHIAIADPNNPQGTVLTSYKLSPRDFEQPNALFNTEFTDVERQSLVDNVIAALSSVTVPQIQQRSVDMFACVDPALGEKIGSGIGFNASSPLNCGE